MSRVTPDSRRHLIIQAAFKLVEREGLGGFSLRRVAAESGLSVGVIRSAFGDHYRLVSAVASEAGDRMERRLVRHPVSKLEGLKGAAAVDAVMTILEEVMPFDRMRHSEAVVTIEFINASRTQPAYADSSTQMGIDLNATIFHIYQTLRVADPTEKTRLTVAVIGGLTLDLITPHGARSISESRLLLRGLVSSLLRGRA